MKKYIGTVLTVLIVIAGIVLGFLFGGSKLTQNQLDTLLILVIICGSSAFFIASLLESYHVTTHKWISYGVYFR